MTRVLTILATAIFLTACGSASAHCPTNDAPGLVSALNPRQQFGVMLKATVERTQTAAMAAARDPSGARQKIAKAIDVAILRHGAEWERNLVDSWQTLSSSEIQRVCTALEDGDKTTFLQFARRIGPRVQSRNEPLLRRAGAEVLQAL